MQSRCIFSWGFAGKPSPSSLRDATSPERGRFYAANRQMQKAPPSGELSSVCETERAHAANIIAKVSDAIRNFAIAPEGVPQNPHEKIHPNCIKYAYI